VPIAFVQAATLVEVASSSTTAPSITLNGVTTGNALVVVASIFDANGTWTVSSVTDGGDTFTVYSPKCTYTASGDIERSVLGFAVDVAGGNVTVSVNLAGTSGGSNRAYAIGLFEYSGVATAAAERDSATSEEFSITTNDVSAGGTGFSTNAADLIVGTASIIGDDTTLNWASPTSWTNRYRQNDGFNVPSIDAGTWLPGSAQTNYLAQWAHDNLSGMFGAAVVVALKAAGPTITAQPVSQTVNNGATATFTVTATSSGGALVYQWKDDGSNVGTNSATYAPAADYTMQGSQITCVVSDDNGSVTSNAATLLVSFNLTGTGPRRNQRIGSFPIGSWGPLGVATAGGGSAPVGLASETDTAFALGSARPAGLASETDSALALAARQILAAGLAVETDTAFARGSARPAGLSIETDSAFARGSARPAGLASEVDSALALTAAHIRQAGLASETDTAFALAAVQIIQAGLAQETDTSFALSPGAGAAVGRADETDSAFALSGVQLRQAGLAQETDSALALAAVQARAAGLAVETDSALALGAVQSLQVGLATETDTALALAAGGALAVGMATEIDTAFSLVGVSLGGVVSLGGKGKKVKADRARLWRTYQGEPVRMPVGLAVERNTAFALGMRVSPAFGARLRAAAEFKRSPWPADPPRVSAPTAAVPPRWAGEIQRTTKAELKLQRTDSESRRLARMRELEAELAALRRST